MTTGPAFPPLMQGLNAAGADPLEAAVAAARDGVEAGTILYDLRPDRLRAAIVLAPEVAVEEAAAMLPLTGVALQNALGALGPSELPVHLQWDGPVRVNGGLCGEVQGRVASCEAGREPAWLVTGFELVIDRGGAAPGETPDLTDLRAEGCGDLDAAALLESWSRHLLNWINRWEDEGMAPLHREWSGLVHGLGTDVTVQGREGRFLGLDERLGLLLKSNGETMLLPLTLLLETRP